MARYVRLPDNRDALASVCVAGRTNRNAVTYRCPAHASHACRSYLANREHGYPVLSDSGYISPYTSVRLVSVCASAVHRMGVYLLQRPLLHALIGAFNRLVRGLWCNYFRSVDILQSLLVKYLWIWASGSSVRGSRCPTPFL